MRMHFTTKSFKVMLTPKITTMYILCNTKEFTTKGVVKNKEQFVITRK